MQKKIVSVLNLIFVPKSRAMLSSNFVLIVEFSSNLKGISIRKEYYLRLCSKLRT